MTDDALARHPTERGRRSWGVGERIGDAALTMLISTLGIRLAFALALRNEGYGDVAWDVQRVLDLLGTFFVAIVVLALLGAWAVLIAPLLAALVLRPLRRGRFPIQVTGLGVTALLTAALPLVVLALAYEMFGDIQSPVATAAWVLIALAAATPVVVFFAGRVLARMRIARIVVVLLALASVIHLVYLVTAN